MWFVAIRFSNGVPGESEPENASTGSSRTREFFLNRGCEITRMDCAPESLYVFHQHASAQLEGNSKARNTTTRQQDSLCKLNRQFSSRTMMRTTSSC